MSKENNELLLFIWWKTQRRMNWAGNVIPFQHLKMEYAIRMLYNDDDEVMLNVQFIINIYKEYGIFSLPPSINNAIHNFLYALGIWNNIPSHHGHNLLEILHSDGILRLKLFHWKSFDHIHHTAQLMSDVIVPNPDNDFAIEINLN